jgi:hypothetical protein
MASAGHTKRLSRIRRRTIPAVQEAFARGDLSARRADGFVYMDELDQKKRLDQLLHARAESERRHKIAAGVIEGYLRTHEGRPDLQELTNQIRSAIA